MFFGMKPSKGGMVMATQRGIAEPITAMPDPVFSEKILGDGACIRPEDGQVFAPCAGTVISVADTGHAIGIRAHDGAELLIHIGIDTVELNGSGFDLRVSVNQRVSLGDLLCAVDLEHIERAGFSAQTAVLLTNLDAFALTRVHTGPMSAKSSTLLEYQAISL